MAGGGDKDNVSAADVARAGQAVARLTEGDATALKDTDAIVKVGKKVGEKGAKAQLFCCSYLIAGAVFLLTFASCAFFGGTCDTADALENNSSHLAGTDLPEELKPIFNAAASKHQISPAFLAAIFFVEHGKSYPTAGPWASSPVGANGPFQFMEGTWEGWSSPNSSNKVFETNVTIIDKYGGYGQDGNSDGKAEVQNLWDSAFAAAELLGKNGAAPMTTDLDKLRDSASRYNSGKGWSSGKNIPETAKYVPLVITEYQRLLGTM